MSGQILTLHPPEFETVPHTVYYQNQETVDLKDYKDIGVGPHTATQWQIWTGPQGTGTLLFDTQQSTSDLQDLDINLPYSYPMTMYMRARQWSQSRISDWSDDLILYMEYCKPYPSDSGYSVYAVTHQNWGGSDAFINQHGIWVMKNGTSNNVLAGDIMSLYGTVVLNGSGNYTIKYACDDDCQVLAYNSSNTLNTTILEWGDSFSSGRGTPQIHAIGWQSGVTKSFSLANDTYTFVFNIYNDPGPGPTWRDNPGGSAFIMTDNANGNVIFDSKDWPTNGFTTAVFCDGGSLGVDGLCHCVVNTITTPTLSISNDPIITDQSFTLLGSVYANQHFSPHTGTIWNCDYTRQDENGGLTQGTPIYSGSGTLISDTATNGTSPAITVARNDAINSQGSYPRLFAISSLYYQAQNGVRSSQSAPVLTSIEYCPPTTATQGSSAYKVDYTQSDAATTYWNQRMKDHAIWIYFQGTNQTLMGQTISIQVSMSFPAGTYYVEANADDSGYITFDGKTIVSGLGFIDSDTGYGTFTVSNTSIGTDVHSVILNAINSYDASNTTWNGNPAGIAAVFYSVDSSGNKTLFTSTDTWPGQTGITINSYYCPGSLELNPDTKTCHCYKSTDTANL